MAKPSKKAKNPSEHYPVALRAELLQHFEAGKGHISEKAKQEICEKYKLSSRKIVTWASDRRRRHGVYDEKRFCIKMLRYINDHPNCPPSQYLQKEFQKVFDNFVKIEGIERTVKFETGIADEKKETNQI